MHEVEKVRAGGRLVAARQRLAFATCFSDSPACGFALVGGLAAQLHQLRLGHVEAAAGGWHVLPLEAAARADSVLRTQLPELETIERANNQGWQ